MAHDLQPLPSRPRAIEPGTAPHLLIAGGGIAALEAALAVREVAGADRLRLTILAPERTVAYAPLAVLEPFVEVPGTEPLSAFAADVEAFAFCGRLASVDVDGRVARTGDGTGIPYDALLVAVGAHPQTALPGAVAFRGSRDADAIAVVVEELATGVARSAAFVVPPTVSWSLPAYELALLTAARVRAAGAPGIVHVVTHEPRPLAAFGSAGSAPVVDKLLDHGIEVHCGVRASAHHGGRLITDDGTSIPVDRAVALAELRARRVLGLPTTDAGFFRVDDRGRLAGVPGVYAAGDATTGAVKQGGLACQQADAAAASILEDLGFAVAASPFRPVLRGVLVSDTEPEYLRRVLDDRVAEPARSLLGGPARVRPHAWPGGKVVGRHLGPYLSAHVEGPGGPDAPLRVAATVER